MKNTIPNDMVIYSCIYVFKFYSLINVLMFLCVFLIDRCINVLFIYLSLVFGDTVNQGNIDDRWMIWGFKTRAWITVLQSTANGTYLEAQEWLCALFLCYGINPTYLPTHCDGCNSKISVCHALDCKKGGLIKNIHNELCDGVAGLAGKSVTPSYVHEYPLIHEGCAVREGKSKPAGPPNNNSPENTEK